jgi:hypothetical protein
MRYKLGQQYSSALGGMLAPSKNIPEPGIKSPNPIRVDTVPPKKKLSGKPRKKY